MPNNYLEYVSTHNVLQIMEAPISKTAVMYDPILGRLTHHKVELIGLVECGDDETPLITPCYLCSNDIGIFWVPDLEPTFITYIHKDSDFDSAEHSDKIKEINEWWKSVEETEKPVKIENKGKISYIRRPKNDGSGTKDDSTD